MLAGTSGTARGPGTTTGRAVPPYGALVEWGRRELHDRDVVKRDGNPRAHVEHRCRERRSKPQLNRGGRASSHRNDASRGAAQRRHLTVAVELQASEESTRALATMPWSQPKRAATRRWRTTTEVLTPVRIAQNHRPQMLTSTGVWSRCRPDNAAAIPLTGLRLSVHHRAARLRNGANQNGAGAVCNELRC